MEQDPEHRLLEPGFQQAELTGPAGRAYEQVAYPGYVYPRTHPARLEVIARLFGLRPPPARTARVLEVGCGDGGNALAIAQTLPEAQVLGFDLTAGPLQHGRALAAEAGLTNVELRCADLLDPEQMAAIGTADYVIAHGIYSWISPAGRGALLALCERCLTAQGVAFVSYNAYPGSHLRDMAREVLAFHLRDVSGPTARLAGAHQLIETIVATESPNPFARVLREHLQRMLDNGDALLYHDDLAEISTPFYLHEFVEHAGAHGLQFLSEAELSDSQLYDVPEAVGKLIASLPDDVVVREQYLDFFTNRMFRQTLLVSSELSPTRAIDDQVVESMAISCHARRESSGFVAEGGATISTTHPLAEAALLELGDRWPRAVSFDGLLRGAGARIGIAEPEHDLEAVGVLRSLLLQAFVARAVRLHGCALPAGGLQPSPRASPLARAQARAGTPVLSTLLPGNHRVAADEDRQLLQALDGTRELATLAAELGYEQSELLAMLERVAAAGLLVADP